MNDFAAVITVTLNTAIDRVLEAENFAVGGHLRAKPISRYPAGKGINVSRALARLNQSNIATGFVGHAEAADFEHFISSASPGRAVSQLLSVRGPTRENITVLDPIHKTDTHLRTSGYQLAAHDVDRMQTKLGLLIRKGSTVIFTGSLPAGLETDRFRDFVTSALKTGARVILDIEGQLLHDVAAGLNQKLWMIAPNRQELAELVPGLDTAHEPSVVNAARRLLEHVEWVLVTLGPQGALLISRTAAWRGTCGLKSDCLVSTVGCGDCMLAGVVVASLKDPDPADWLKLGLAAATANAATTGIAEFDEAAVSQLLPQAQVRRL
jgi:1-phosphofructokinase family hexose kinase